MRIRKCDHCRFSFDTKSYSWQNCPKCGEVLQTINSNTIIRKKGWKHHRNKGNESPNHLRLIKEVVVND